MPCQVLGVVADRGEVVEPFEVELTLAGGLIVASEAVAIEEGKNSLLVVVIQVGELGFFGGGERRSQAECETDHSFEKNTLHPIRLYHALPNLTQLR